MIRAWTILEPKAKNPTVWKNGGEFQYPVFRTMKEAKAFRKIISINPANRRIVRCQIRIEGQR